MQAGNHFEAEWEEAGGRPVRYFGIVACKTGKNGRINVLRVVLRKLETSCFRGIIGDKNKNYVRPSSS